VLRAVAEGLEDVNASDDELGRVPAPFACVAQRVRTGFGLPAACGARARGQLRGGSGVRCPGEEVHSKGVIEAPSGKVKSQARRMSCASSLAHASRGRWTASRSTTSMQHSIPTQALRRPISEAIELDAVAAGCSNNRASAPPFAWKRWVRRQCRRRASCRACGTRQAAGPRQWRVGESGCCMLSSGVPR